MPQPYIENIRRWVAESEVDYFSYFIKAWIPFNAWFRNHYDEGKSERNIIDLIKSDGNVVRSRIIRLLSEADAEADAFREHLAQLHLRLERHTLTNRSRRVTFTDCYIGTNSNNQATEVCNRVTYTLERSTPRTPNNQVLCEVIGLGGRGLFHKLQLKYNLAELQAESSFIALSQFQRSKIEALYKSINPRLEVDLSDTSNGHMNIGSIQFCNSPNNIFAGMVENIYSLRCLLFHGEVVPTSEINGVYESAYYILKRFIKSVV
ncbi:MAG TPA: hypothetical protein VJT09_14585 [Pyrinomonadaceae bacterium]|nr:hypothetical protein [Pyrinomonadaceae bacterium]